MSDGIENNTPQANQSGQNKIITDPPSEADEDSPDRISRATTRLLLEQINNDDEDTSTPEYTPAGTVDGSVSMTDTPGPSMDKTQHD